MLETPVFFLQLTFLFFEHRTAADVACNAWATSIRRAKITTMSAPQSDEFNFVGLARSPIKQTPSAGYYAGGHASNKRDEPSSAATTERMSTGSISGGSSASSRRRHALHPVTTNVVNTADVVGAHTPSASPSYLALLSSTISSKKGLSAAAIAARRSTSILPVSRTLKLSPVDTAGQDSIMSRRAGSSRSSHLTGAGRASPLASNIGALFSVDPYVHTPHGSRNTSLAGPTMAGRAASPTVSSTFISDHEIIEHSSSSSFQSQPSTPAVIDPYLSSASATGAASSDDDGDGEWSDCSFTRAVFSPDPATPALPPPPPRAVIDVGCETYENDKEGPARAASPIDKAYSPPAASSASSGMDATPLCAPGSHSLSPAEGGSAAMPNASITDTPAAATALLRMGGRLTTNESICSTVFPPADVAGEDVPNTPAAAATLVAMGGGRASATISVCGSVEEKTGWKEDDEEGEMLCERHSELSTDVQVRQCTCGRVPTAVMRYIV